MSLTASTWRQASMFQILMFFQVAFFYYVVMSKSITSPADIDIVVVALMCSLIFQSCLAVLQYLTGSQLNYFSTGHSLEGEYQVTRAFGTNLGRPNALAAAAAPILLMSVAILFGTDKHRRLATAACGAGFLGLVVTFSRGAWIGFIAGCVVLAAALYRDGLFKTSRPWRVILLGGVLIAVFFPYLRARVVGDYMNPAMVSRIPLMGAAIAMIKTHPVFGVGVNTFRSIIGSYITGPYFYVDEVHNQYLLVFSEAGIFGLGGWLWIILRGFRTSTLCLAETTDKTLKYVALGVGAGFLACSIHMMFDLYNSQALLGNLFIMASVVGAANAFRRRPILVVQRDF
jgi:putative inorganic carbon (hco3(-)) transporter